jgi:hypothetical protein
LFKTDQISAAKLAVKEEEARQKGSRKLKREQEGRDRTAETETEQGSWTADGSQTQNRSASLLHPNEDAVGEPSSCFVETHPDDR